MAVDNLTLYQNRQNITSLTLKSHLASNEALKSTHHKPTDCPVLQSFQVPPNGGPNCRLPRQPNSTNVIQFTMKVSCISILSHPKWQGCPSSDDEHLSWASRHSRIIVKGQQPKQSLKASFAAQFTTEVHCFACFVTPKVTVFHPVMMEVYHEFATTKVAGLSIQWWWTSIISWFSANCISITQLLPNKQQLLSKSLQITLDPHPNWPWPTPKHTTGSLNHHRGLDPQENQQIRPWNPK